MDQRRPRGGMCQRLHDVAAASSHREAPAIAEDPVGRQHRHLRVGRRERQPRRRRQLHRPRAARGRRRTGRSSRTTCSTRSHIARGATSLADALTYQIQFKTAPVHRRRRERDAAREAPEHGGLEFFAQLSGGGAFDQTYTVTKVENGTADGHQPRAASRSRRRTSARRRTGRQRLHDRRGDTYEKHFVDTPAASTRSAR